MSDPTTPEVTPDESVKAATSKPKWWRRRFWKLPTWAWIIIAVFVIGGIGGAFDQDDDANESASTGVAAVPETSKVAPSATNVPSETASTTGTDSVMAQWYDDHGDMLDATIVEISQAADAATALDLPEMQRASRVVSGNMTIMANSLNGETDPVAVKARNAFNTCAVAYESAADAVADMDSAAIEASTTLLQSCSTGMNEATAAITGD